MDGIERSLYNRAEVLRLNVTDGVGRELAIRYGVTGVPTLILLDADGDVVLRQTGRLKQEDVVEAVTELTK